MAPARRRRRPAAGLDHDRRSPRSSPRRRRRPARPRRPRRRPPRPEAEEELVGNSLGQQPVPADRRLGRGARADGAIVPDDCWGDFPSSHYDIGCDEGAWNHIGRKVYCTFTDLSYQGARSATATALWIVEWAYAFGVLRAAGRPGHHDRRVVRAEHDRPAGPGRAGVVLRHRLGRPARPAGQALPGRRRAGGVGRHGRAGRHPAGQPVGLPRRRVRHDGHGVGGPAVDRHGQTATRRRPRRRRRPPAAAGPPPPGLRRGPLRPPQLGRVRHAGRVPRHARPHRGRSGRGATATRPATRWRRPAARSRPSSTTTRAASDCSARSSP